jgi:hypothetical protein
MREASRAPAEAPRLLGARPRVLIGGPVVDRPERRLLGPHRGVHPRRSAPDKCAPCRTPVKLRRRFVRTIRLMLTAELDSQLDTDRRQIIMDDHLPWSKMVARGGVEPPTFRFSGLGIIVR